MSATIKTVVGTATVTNGTWTGDEKLAEFLNEHEARVHHGGEDPNPDLTSAQAAIELFPGKITEFDEEEYEEGVVY